MNSIDIEQRIRDLAVRYAAILNERVDQRLQKMEADDKSHYLIYRVLGITIKEGDLIDIYQNKGRFLYRYAGAFLEEVAKLCIVEKYPDASSIRIPNTIGARPRTFQIDCLLDGKDAIEIKWRDATTDGDHITKEHVRMQSIALAGYKPVRVMFFYPNREQAQRIQSALQTLYAGAGGEYHYGDAAWNYILDRTGIDLKAILESIAGLEA